MQIATFSGLHCDACVKLITKRLLQLPEILSIKGNPSGHFELQGSITYTTAQINQTLTGTDYSLKTLE